MNKDQALQTATAGKKVKRKSWPAGKHIYMKDGRYYVSEPGVEDTFYELKDEVKNGRKVPHEDRMTEDWAIFEDEMPASETDTKVSTVKANFVNNKNEAKPQILVRS